METTERKTKLKEEERLIPKDRWVGGRTDGWKEGKRKGRERGRKKKK